MVTAATEFQDRRLKLLGHPSTKMASGPKLCLPKMLYLMSSRFAVFKSADMALAVELYAELFDELQLRFQKVDVMLLVDEEVVIELLGHTVMNGDAIFGGFCIEGARGDFGGKVAADNFLHRLSDPQLIKDLQIGKPFEKKYACDKAIGMAHFLDRFFA